MESEKLGYFQLAELKKILFFLNVGLNVHVKHIE